MCAPSSRTFLIQSSASTRRNTSSATFRPAMMQASRATIFAAARRFGSVKYCVVTSPSPMSSASAKAMRSVSGRMDNMCGRAEVEQVLLPAHKKRSLGIDRSGFERASWCNDGGIETQFGCDLISGVSQMLKALGLLPAGTPPSGPRRNGPLALGNVQGQRQDDFEALAATIAHPGSREGPPVDGPFRDSDDVVITHDVKRGPVPGTRLCVAPIP